MPCPADIYSTYMQEDDSDEASAGERASVSGEMSDRSEESGERASGSADEEMSDWSEESGDRASVSSEEEMSLSEPGLDFDDYESDWFILRTKLWKILGYPVIHDKIQNVWQRNLEMEISGWPVVPLEAFSEPDAHSTTAKCR